MRSSSSHLLSRFHQDQQRHGGEGEAEGVLDQGSGLGGFIGCSLRGALERFRGLAVQPLSRGLAEEFRTPVSSGVLVTEVERGGLASRCGLLPGDVITEIGQQPISSLDEFKSALKRANFTKGVLVNVTSPDGRRFVVLRDND